MLAAELGKCFVRALNDALAADVDPGASRHLAVHHQPLAIERVEILPGRPVRHEVGVGDQHARCVDMGAEHANRLAGLHQKRFVALEPLQGRGDTVEAVPVSRGAADAAIDHQFVGSLRHVRVEVVHQHPQRGFGEPAFCGQRGPMRRANDASVGEAGQAIIPEAAGGIMIVHPRWPAGYQHPPPPPPRQRPPTA